MPAKIINGRTTREALLPELIAKIKKLSHTPTLAIIQVGDRPDSASFIAVKKDFAAKIGVNIEHIKLPETVSEPEVIGKIKRLNEDASIQGIIVQLPLPPGLDRNTIIDTIDPKKDVDGLTHKNTVDRENGLKKAIFPATARGVMELLGFNEIGLHGKKVTVIGRSKLVGAPISLACRRAGADVTLCHSKTPGEEVVHSCKQSDIIIVAVGKPKLVTADHVKSGQIIIDVGINTVAGEKLEDEITGRKIIGDVDFEEVSKVVAAITPVPGGVGPMTVLALFENLVDLCEY